MSPLNYKEETKMKKSILLLIPLVLTLAGCGDSNQSSSISEIESTTTPSSTIPNQEEVNEVKALLDKQDLSPFYSRYIKGSYIQEYDVLDIDNDYDLLEVDAEDEGKVSSYFNYAGRGLFGSYYDLTADEYNSIVDENGNIDTFDAIAIGKGYWGITQLMRTMSFSREDGLEAKINNLDIQQSTYLKSTDEDVWVDNTLFVSDDGVFHYETRQELSASINKELLFSSISTRTFREIFSKVNLFDAPGNVEHLDKLFFSTCRGLISKSDKEISDFIIENQVSIQEDEEGNIKLNFVFINEDIEEDEADYIFPGTVKGTLIFDKDTYQFSSFSYNMSYKLEVYDEDTGSIRLVNMKFSCIGESAHEVPEDSWAPTNPTVYDDVAEFLKDVNEQVVPPEISL